MLQRGNFIEAEQQSDSIEPPKSLQYIVVALAATLRDDVEHLALHYYQYSRAYAEIEETQVNCMSSLSQKINLASVSYKQPSQLGSCTVLVTHIILRSSASTLLPCLT